MFESVALRRYYDKASECATNLDAVDMRRKHSNYTNQRSRLMSSCQSLPFRVELDRQQEQAEGEVFPSFLNKLSTFQQQLDTRCHGDQFFRDIWCTSVEIPAFQAPLRDRMPRTLQKPIYRIASTLSEKPKVVGTATSAHFTSVESEEELTSQAVYTLGQRNTNCTKREVKTCSPKLQRRFT